MQIPLRQAIGRYQAGETLRDIALDAGVSPQTVGRRLQEAGIALRGKKKTPRQRQRLSEAKRMELPDDILRQCHMLKMTCREIAEVLGCHEETVRGRLADLELPRLPAKARTAKNYFWRGGFSVDEDGYILQKAPGHPYPDRRGYVRQHRLVMEQALGRYLTLEEVVDHRNGDTSDNEPGNLRLFPCNTDHLRATLTGKKVPPEERERLKREARLRARRRVAAILAASGNDGTLSQ